MNLGNVFGDAIIAHGIYEEIKDSVKDAADKISAKVGINRDDALIQGAVSLTVQLIHSAIRDDDDEDEDEPENAPNSHDMEMLEKLVKGTAMLNNLEHGCCHCDSKPEPSDEDDARTALAKLLGL